MSFGPLGPGIGTGLISTKFLIVIRNAPLLPEMVLLYTYIAIFVTILDLTANVLWNLKMVIIILVIKILGRLKKVNHFECLITPILGQIISAESVISYQ